MRIFRMGVTVAALALLAACDGIFAPEVQRLSGRQLSVGESTVCALDNTRVLCWGRNDTSWSYGVDPATLPASSSPVHPDIPDLTVIATGVGQHMCGITPALKAVCWGRGDFGQLGSGVVGAAGNPVRNVISINSWSNISVGRLSTCAVTSLGVGYCWGSNQRGEIGDTAIAYDARTSLASPVSGGIVFKSIVAGWRHTCGIAVQGAAYCWGDNSSGQLGIGFSDPYVHNRPLLVSFTQKFIQLSLGARSTCGITTDHRLLCWGFNGTGQLGDGTLFERHEPTPIASDLSFSEVALASGFAGGTTVVTPSSVVGGAGHTCALTVDGVPYCWGWNAAGQVGDGTTVIRLVPVQVGGDLRLSSIGLGGAFTCGSNASSIWCWGSNTFGQLGNGGMIDSPLPVAVVSPFAH